MFDLIIKNAFVIDGSGEPGFFADVAVTDGKIARLGNDLGQAREYLDAKGLTLTPGFVDSHSHGDYYVLTPDHRDNVQQGITFSVSGHCGGSIAPSIRNEKLLTMGELVQQLEGKAISNHYAILTGHGDIRHIVGANGNRPVTEEELAQMCKLLEESMDQGSMGLSLGLTYAPSSYADIQELTALATVVAKKGGIVTAHIRNESDKLLSSVEEFITVCRNSGCRGVISHLKAADAANHGKLKTVLTMIEQAQADGVEVFADAYPYCASSTSFNSRFIPRQFHPAGTTDPISLLDDPQIREQIKAWATKKWGTDLSWVLVTNCKGHPEYRGMTMNEIAASMGIADRYEAVFALLKDARRINACFTMMSEADVAVALAHRFVMVGCDSTPGNGATLFHPRRVGTFPRVLGRFVREKGITSLPEMIRKITSLPAQVYGLAGKGRIAEGFDADLCLFDPETICDHADYVNCSEPNTGLHYVLIGGKLVVENGAFNGTYAGRIWLHK